MNNDIKLFYELTAKKTADEWYPNDILKPTIKNFLSYLPENPRILDLGCGPGHESMRLFNEGAQVMGIDFSPKCIKIARQRNKKFRFEVLDFRQLDKGYGKFDGVFACASLIHLDKYDMPDVLKRINKILNENGFLITIILNGNGVLEEKSQLKVDNKNLIRTVYGYTREVFLNLAKNAEFKFISPGFLDEELIKYGWRVYILKKHKDIAHKRIKKHTKT